MILASVLGSLSLGGIWAIATAGAERKNELHTKALVKRFETYGPLRPISDQQTADLPWREGRKEGPGGDLILLRPPGGTQADSFLAGTSVAVILHVPLCRFFVMFGCIQVVAMRQMGVLSRLGMIALVVMLGREFVVLRRVLMVLGRFLVVVGNGVRLICHDADPVGEYVALTLWASR